MTGLLGRLLEPLARYLLPISVSSLERVRPSEEGARRPRRRVAWPTAAVIVASHGARGRCRRCCHPVLLAEGRLPVTTDPPPASNIATAQTFAPTKGLISDPFVLPTSTLDYMYSSGIVDVGQMHLPERTFNVMGKFLSLRDAVPTLPAWVEPNTALWSPDVRKVGKTYVMWFSGLDQDYMLAPGVLAQCIGVATSTSPTGPFTSHSPAPIICQTSGHGDIDPRTLVAPNGQEWLYWKNDGNAVVMGRAVSTHIYAQRLAPDGQTLLGASSVLLTNDLPWEVDLIEAPDMVHVANRYLLFFSDDATWDDASGIGLALCKGPGGPCTSPYCRAMARIQCPRRGTRRRDRLHAERHHLDALHPARALLPLGSPEAGRRANSLHPDRDALHRQPPGNGARGDGWKGRASRLALTGLRKGTPSVLGQCRPEPIRVGPHTLLTSRIAVKSLHVGAQSRTRGRLRHSRRSLARSPKSGGSSGSGRTTHRLRRNSSPPPGSVTSRETGVRSNSTGQARTVAIRSHPVHRCHVRCSGIAGLLRMARRELRSPAAGNRRHQRLCRYTATLHPYDVDPETATKPSHTHVSRNSVHAVRRINRCPRGSRGAERANLERATGAVARIQHLTTPHRRSHRS